MFLPPNLTTITLKSLAILLLLAGSTDAQQAEFNRRAMAMQEARARAQQPPPVRLASSDNDMAIDYAAPPSPMENVRVARAPSQRSNAATNGRFGLGQIQRAPQRMAPGTNTSNRVTSRFVPQHIRSAQLMRSAIDDGGAPIVNSGPIGSEIYEGEVFGEEIIDGGCASCGDSGGYFDQCDSCCGRGGCPPGQCWINGFGALLRNAEYFDGATSFRSALFTLPGVGETGDRLNDNSHGFYGGFNVGLPLCRLSCGLFSTQFGVRSVQTNVNGNGFTSENRNQTFMTLGFYRRVDYGIQAGIAIDYLNEKWFTEVDLTQIRGDIGWVYPNGSTLGFRYAFNVKDDVAAGVINGTQFTNSVQSTQESYRFYGNCDSDVYGLSEGFLGWTNNSQWVLGMDFDLPIRERLAMQSGFAYYLGEEGVPIPTNQVGGNANDTYNIYVGLVFRPRGREHNRSYDRPLFSVADNGTMLITRN